MSVSIDDSILGQLNTSEAKTLHDVSESLTSCGVGKIVNLPQIVVVGDQSSGKSSVLEAISRVKFPVEGGLCTRFATELVLRQAPEMRVKVNIRFADSTKSSHCFQRTDFSQDDLPEIIQEAKESMGLSNSGQEFSKDVLRLEIEGPKMYPLTLVDLPGLFHSDTETQSLGGKQTVDQLVEDYMKQKNSIILVVVTANQQLASHDALRRVKMFDPQRERTIGVITKPDLSGYANETHYVRVAKNEEGANRLKYGWHVLRNRAENEPNLSARDEVEEKFFASGSWASIPKQDVGIASFRKKLSKVLYEHLRASLPSVVEDIEAKLQARQDALTQLGDPRSDVGDMRSFLLSVAGEFQRLARDGTYGRYNDPFFGGMDEEDRKLRALLRNFSRVFENVVRTKGCKDHITEDGKLPEEKDLPIHLQKFLKKHPYAFDDPEIMDMEDLREDLENQASANQGREFPGTANQELAMQLFQKQASPWKSIAEYHIGRVTLVAKSFVGEIFEHILGPAASNPSTESILAGCVDPFFQETERNLKDKLTELLEPYTQGFASPPDVELKRAMREQSFGRLMSQLCDALEEKRPDLFEQEYRTPLTRNMILEACDEEDIEDGEFGAGKVVHMMLAYYEPSRRTFTDNVVNLAIESCLVRKIPDILSPTRIGKMSDEELSELAAESEESQSRRRQLQEEVEVLENGLIQCRKYRPRNLTALPSGQRKCPSRQSSSRRGDGESVHTPQQSEVPLSRSQSQKPPRAITPTSSSKSTPANSTPVSSPSSSLTTPSSTISTGTRSIESTAKPPLAPSFVLTPEPKDCVTPPPSSRPVLYSPGQPTNSSPSRSGRLGCSNNIKSRRSPENCRVSGASPSRLSNDEKASNPSNTKQIKVGGGLFRDRPPASGAMSAGFEDALNRTFEKAQSNESFCFQTGGLFGGPHTATTPTS